MTESIDRKEGGAVLNIFDTFDAIVAIKRSQWRNYAKQWRGLQEVDDVAAYNQSRQEFIERYIEDRLIPFDKEGFHANFINQLKTNTRFRQRFENNVADYCQSIAQRIQLAFGKGRYIGIDPGEDKEILVRKLLDFFKRNPHYLDFVPMYEDERNDEYYDYLMTHRDILEDEAGREFDAENKPDKFKTGKIDVSRVYKDFFESLRSDNKLNTKYRIYFPIEITTRDIAASSEKNTDLNPDQYKIKTILKMCMSYVIDEYYSIKGKPFPKEASAFAQLVQDPDKFYGDILEGYFYDSTTKRKERIGKMFSLVKKKDPDFEVHGNFIDEIEKAFISRPVGFKGMVCISRHPHDIAAMSTDRGWTSCMNLNKPTRYTRHVGGTIMSCGLIAYLIREGDTKIEKPTSRLLIKPYVKEKEEMDYEHPNWILVVSDTYGTVYRKFTESVQNWVDIKWNDRIEDEGNTKWMFDNNFYYERDDAPYYTLDSLRNRRRGYNG